MEDISVLIVYSTFGDGHVQAAKAILQSLEARGVKRVHMVDLLAESHPYWNAVSRFTYLQSSTYFPQLYGFSYNVTNQAEPDPHLSRLFHSIGKRKLKKIVEELRPDAVIHTFPYLAMSQLCAEFGYPIPTFTVITDYVLHSRWVHPDVSRYFVATDSVKQALKTAGIEESRIVVSGIPLRDCFGKPADKAGLCRKLNLDPNRKYVLISAGAYGVQASVRTMADAVLGDPDYDLLLVCGRNRKLFEKMDMQYGSHPRVRVTGFVEQMQEWMAVSFCLLTKAGGITLTEALSIPLPVIVYRPLPGQEQGNAETLSAAGTLYTAGDAAELSARLSLLKQETARGRLLRAMKAVYRPNAAQTIADELLQSVAEFRISPVSAGRTDHPNSLR